MRVDAWWEKVFKKWLQLTFVGSENLFSANFCTTKYKKKPLISLNGKHLQMQLTKFSLWSYVRWDIFSPHALYASFMAEWRRFISMTLSQQHHNRQIWKNCENLIKIKFHKILHIFHHWHSPNSVCEAIQRSKGTNIMITMSLQKNILTKFGTKVAFNLYIFAPRTSCQRWHT